MTPLLALLCALLSVPEVDESDDPATALHSHLAAVCAAWSPHP